MSSSTPSPSNQSKHHEDQQDYTHGSYDHEDYSHDHDHYSKVIKTLPSRPGWGQQNQIKYGQFWYPYSFLVATMAIHDKFQPQPTDIFVVTHPKSGTTWIKAIVFAIVNRTRFPFDNNHPLLAYNPHICVPFLEQIYNNNGLVQGQLKELSRPRVLGLHAPYSALSPSLTNSNCHIVYLCRNPKDVLVSLWHFLTKMYSEVAVPFEEVFEMFCQGRNVYGPVWEHMLEYWRESLRRPDRILFLKYEELKGEPVKNVRRLAEFVGYPFSEEEVKEGVVEEIIKLCSLEKLSNAQVNKNNDFVASEDLALKNSLFFRKGNVGDWKQHLTSEMAQKLDQIMEEKLRGSGLTFC